MKHLNWFKWHNVTFFCFHFSCWLCAPYVYCVDSCREPQAYCRACGRMVLVWIGVFFPGCRANYNKPITMLKWNLFAIENKNVYTTILFIIVFDYWNKVLRGNLQFTLDVVDMTIDISLLFCENYFCVWV